jgi:hypothetical protein
MTRIPGESSFVATALQMVGPSDDAHRRTLGEK